MFSVEARATSSRQKKTCFSDPTMDLSKNAVYLPTCPILIGEMNTHNDEAVDGIGVLQLPMIFRYRRYRTQMIMFNNQGTMVPKQKTRLITCSFERSNTCSSKVSKPNLMTGGTAELPRCWMCTRKISALDSRVLLK